jgi:uncharacterized protein YkwD
MGSFFYSLFIPHASNNHRARILHHETLAFLIAILLFASFFFPSSFSPFSQKISAFADISLRELLNYTNQQRQLQGLKPLAENSELNVAAQRKAADMLTNNYWAHNSPSGTTPWSFISGAGYDYVYAGENLARGFNSAKDVVNAWMASPDHRANILSPNYRDVGFSVQHGQLSGEETFLVVQEFGSKSILPTSTNILSPPEQKRVLGLELSPIIENIKSVSISSRIVIGILLIILGVFMLDLLFMRKKQIPRVAGHSLDHSLFVASIIIVVVIFGIGTVL